MLLASLRFRKPGNREREPKFDYFRGAKNTYGANKAIFRRRFDASTWADDF
jgi:hypothetical protein